MCLSVCDLEKSQRGGLDPSWAVVPRKKNGNTLKISRKYAYSNNINKE